MFFSSKIHIGLHTEISVKIFAIFLVKEEGIEMKKIENSHEELKKKSLIVFLLHFYSCTISSQKLIDRMTGTFFRIFLEGISYVQILDVRLVMFDRKI
jgi:hypothetical protein